MQPSISAPIFSKKSNSRFLRECRQLAEAHEQKLHPKAAFSKDHSRLLGLEDDYRLPYKRDIDRIVHSKAYARYTDKTQVVYLVENDHITHRGLHVQFVSNFARGIAELLQLNLDLVEAIALGHDVGHPPFGHEGEEYLSALSLIYCQTPFAHPWQSCRLFSDIEPLRLGLAVYDGFLCHDGGSTELPLIPHYGKTWEMHMSEKAIKLAQPNAVFIPGTLEGCLVKLCDTISYLGKDIEDAIHLGILSREQVPITILGVTNREILNGAACDIIENSYGKEYISLSPEVLEAIKVLRKFNFENIYVHPLLKTQSAKIQRSYGILFETLLSNYQDENEKSYLWNHFLSDKPASYFEGATAGRIVIDYISGMTDSYFMRTLKEFIIPERIHLI